MTLYNLLYYISDNFIIYPRNFNQRVDIEKCNEKYVIINEPSNLKFDTEKNILYLVETEIYNVESINNNLFSKEQFNTIGEYFNKQFGRLQYINYIGFTEFSGVSIYVMNKKINETDFRIMVNKIQDTVIDLVYDFNKPTYFKTNLNQKNSTTIDYHKLRFLLSLLETIKPDKNIYNLLDLIMKIPHVKLEYSLDEYLVAEGNEFYNSDCDLTGLVTGTDSFISFNNSNLKSNSLVRKIHQKSGKFLIPEKVQFYNNYLDYDTHENRFIKYFITLITKMLMNLSKIIEKEKRTFNNLDKKITKHIKRLNMYLQYPFFKNIGNLTFIPFQSQVLNKKEGYKQLFNYFNIINAQHSIIFDEEIDQIIDSKKIDKIYELWCYFTVIDIAKKIYGSAGSQSRIIFRQNQVRKFFETENGSCYYEFSDQSGKFYNANIYFQKNFTAPESYSQSYDPDICIEILDNQRQIVKRYLLDAKFKVDLKRDSKFKPDDINKMHAYLDAINKAHGSYILYPGNHQKIFNRNSKIKYQGVGAFCLNPNNQENQSSLESFLEYILLKGRKEENS